MFNRKVKIGEGVYSYHEVDLVKHAKDLFTEVRVCSYVTSPYLGESTHISTSLAFPFDDAMTFALAEQAVMEDPAFAEYVDPEEAILQELAGDLTDEQAATVQQIYPQWDSTERYALDERVRYSDGFYRCVQDHTAQADWNPVQATSLWAAIINATVVPVDGYPVWQQPSSTNPYMIGDKVVYGEFIWESDIDYNVWAPGVYGWVVYIKPDTETDIPEWEQPDSTHPYMMGDRVMFEGAVYESTVDNNVWAPNVYGWELIQ